MTLPRSLLLLALTLALLVGSTTAANSTTSASTTATTANATTDGSANTTTRCDEELLFQKLYVLMPAINQCAKEAGYFVASSQLTAPTNETLDKFCASANCTKLAVDLDDAGLPSCTVLVGATELPFKDFFNQIKAHCSSATSGKGGGNSKSAAASSAALGWWRLGLAAVLAALVGAAL